MPQPSSPQAYDLIIVGAGPAGISAALQAQQRGLSFLVLESGGKIAGTIQNFSDGKWIMAEPDALPLRSPLHFEAGSREQLLRSWSELCRQRQLPIRFGSRYRSISGEQGNFRLTLEDGESLHCRQLLLAFGVQGKPRGLNCPSANLDRLLYQLPANCDWQQQQIAVVGAGDSAIEDALTLCRHNRVVLINRGDDFRRAKSGNRKAIMSALAAGQLQCLFQSDITAVDHIQQRLQLLIEQRGQQQLLLCDHVLLRIGSLPIRPELEALGVGFNSAASDAQLRLDGNGQTTVAGLYVAGALSGQPLIKQAINQGFNAVEAIAGHCAPALELELLQQQLQHHGLPDSATHLLSWLTQLPLLRGCDSQQLLPCLAQASIENIDSRRQLLAKGEYSDRLWLILRGQCTVHSHAGNSRTLTAGRAVGEMPLLSQSPSPYSVDAETGTVLVVLSRSTLDRLQSQFSPLADRLHRLYLRRLIGWVLAPNSPDKMLDLLLRDSLLQRFKAGDELLGTQHLATTVKLLVTGSASRQRSAGQFQRFDSGQFIGLEQLLHGADAEPVRAQVDGRCLSISLASLQALAQLNPALIDNCRQLLLQQRGHISRPDAKAINFQREQQLTNGTDILAIDKNLCIGCDNCEHACASSHDGQSRLARRKGSSFQNIHLPASCRHCQEPACLSDCPADAISRSSSGEIDISDRCIGCGNCESSCPFDVIQLVDQAVEQPQWWRRLLGHSDNQATAVDGGQKAVKCDGCQQRREGPACVQACPTGAAKRMSPQQLIPLIDASQLSG